MATAAVQERTTIRSTTIMREAGHIMRNRTLAKLSTPFDSCNYRLDVGYFCHMFSFQNCAVQRSLSTGSIHKRSTTRSSIAPRVENDTRAFSSTTSQRSLSSCARIVTPGQQANERTYLVERELAPRKLATGEVTLSPLAGAVLSGNWVMFRKIHDSYEELTGHRWWRQNVRATK